MGQTAIRSFHDCFSTLKDPRVKRSRRHELLDIIIIAVSAVICEAETWVDVAEFGRIRLEWFDRLTIMVSRVPSPAQWYSFDFAQDKSFPFMVNFRVNP